jgi:anti-anti-sigma regulatory factor
VAPEPVILDVDSLRSVDAATVGTLALLRLVAREGGLDLRLARARPELCALIEFLGLGRALPVEPGRQPEEREETLGVEEERELGDGAA